MTTITQSEEETADVGRRLAASLGPGAVILLRGTLGAGKTAFVRGLAAGLGIDANDVSSPTFTLLHEYRGGRLTLFHADLYRLERAGLDEVGLDAREVEAGVLAVEWPERLSTRIPGAVEVEIAITGDLVREIRMS